jgi:subfamily B ATP-binding cassette protein MsbA
VATANERIQQTAQAGIQGHRDVKLFGRRDRTFSSFRDAVDDYADATVRLRRTEATLKGCYRLGAATVVFGLVYLALTAPSLSLGSAAVFLFAMFRLAPRFSTLNSLAYGISGDLPHLARARETLDELADASRPSGDVTPAPPVAELSVDGVGFAYEDDPVLDGVTIHLSRGDTVALVGPSGGGKSTIVALLARLQDPDSGVVRADGTPLPQFDLAAWRQQVAVVRQDPYLFDETLRANVAVGDPTATDAAVRRACRRACVDEFVDDLPAGLDTPLGEDGVSLSGGQRQRVAIARALLEDASVLVLDEATSDLDPTIEAAVHEGLAEGDDDRITVLVSHRLASVADVDRIYTVADGAIAEVGDHDSLLDDDGTYAAMVAAGSRDDRRG